MRSLAVVGDAQEVRARKRMPLKLNPVTQTVTIVTRRSWEFPLLSPATRLRAAPLAPKPKTAAQRSLEGAQADANAKRS